MRVPFLVLVPPYSHSNMQSMPFWLQVYRQHMPSSACARHVCHQDMPSIHTDSSVVCCLFHPVDVPFVHHGVFSSVWSNENSHDVQHSLELQCITSFVGSSIGLHVVATILTTLISCRVIREENETPYHARQTCHGTIASCSRTGQTRALCGIYHAVRLSVHTK